MNVTFCQPPRRSQRGSKTPFPVWLSRVHLPVPSQENIAQKLYEVIHSMGGGHEVLHLVNTVGVDAEWIGLCQAVMSSGEAPSEKEKYEHLRRDASSTVVLLYGMF